MGPWSFWQGKRIDIIQEADKIKTPLLAHDYLFTNLQRSITTKLINVWMATYKQALLDLAYVHGLSSLD